MIASLLQTGRKATQEQRAIRPDTCDAGGLRLPTSVTGIWAYGTLLSGQSANHPHLGCVTLSYLHQQSSSWAGLLFRSRSALQHVPNGERSVRRAIEYGEACNCPAALGPSFYLETFL